MKGRKEVRVYVTKRKTITGMVIGRKEAGKKGTTEKAARGKVSKQGDAKRRSYSEAVIEGGIENRKGIYGRLHFAKDRRVENVLGHDQGGSTIVHVGTNSADREATTRIVQSYRELVETLKKTRFKYIILSGIL